MLTIFKYSKSNSQKILGSGSFRHFSIHAQRLVPALSLTGLSFLNLAVPYPLHKIEDLLVKLSEGFRTEYVVGPGRNSLAQIIKIGEWLNATAVIEPVLARAICVDK